MPTPAPAGFVVNRRLYHAPGSAVVNWGDGSAPQTLTAANFTSRRLEQRGVITGSSLRTTTSRRGHTRYTVVVTDDGGSTTTISGSAIIADAAADGSGPDTHQHDRSGHLPASGVRPAGL